MKMNKNRLRGSNTPKRDALVSLLFQQIGQLPIDRVETDLAGIGGCFSFILTIHGKHYRTLILVRSSDYWQRRVHLALQKQNSTLDLLVVWEHDSCIPCEVLALKTGILHTPFAVTAQSLTIRNRYTSRILLGQLLCGVQAGYDTLEKLPRSTQYRYLAHVATLSKRTRGRPLKV